jgi:hypothetical protein
MIMSDDSRYQFWTDLIEKGASTDAYYHGFNPRSSGAIQQRTGIPGVYLCFRIRESYSQVTVTIEKIGFERSLNFFQQLHQHREEIENGISSTLEWQPANESTSSSRIIATLEFEGPHPKYGVLMTEWYIEKTKSSVERHKELMIATMDEFREVLLPYIHELQDMK